MTYHGLTLPGTPTRFFNNSGGECVLQQAAVQANRIGALASPGPVIASSRPTNQYRRSVALHRAKAP